MSKLKLKVDAKKKAKTKVKVSVKRRKKAAIPGANGGKGTKQSNVPQTQENSLKTQGVDGDPFAEMVVEFKKLFEEHAFLKPLQLLFEVQRPGVILAYQGTKSNVWVWLRNTGCTFVRTSPLRIILGLSKDHPLYQYFKDYSLQTGEKSAAL